MTAMRTKPLISTFVVEEMIENNIVYPVKDKGRKEVCIRDTHRNNVVALGVERLGFSMRTCCSIGIHLYLKTIRFEHGFISAGLHGIILACTSSTSWTHTTAGGVRI